MKPFVLSTLLLVSSLEKVTADVPSEPPESWHPASAASAAQASATLDADIDHNYNATLPFAAAVAAADDDLSIVAPTGKALGRQTHYLSPALQQFILQMNGFDSEEHFQRRQAQGGLGGGAGPVDPATLPTQVPTVTTFNLGGSLIPYTQRFSPTPDQWPSPSRGSIGLGTHTGQVGVVRTNAASIENLKVRGIGAAAIGAGIGGYLAL